MGTEEAQFGTVLRRQRLSAGLSQEALAERAGLSADALSALERGKRRAPYAKTLRALVDALGLNQEDQLAFEASARSARRPRRPLRTRS